MGLEDEMAATLPNLATERAHACSPPLFDARASFPGHSREPHSRRVRCRLPRGGVVRLRQDPREVLSFWFGEDAYFGDAPERMSDGEYMKTKSRSLWYAGTSADAACMPFVATIEAAASGALDDHPAWSARPDGDFARVILFDQLARNCFRGTPRAFAFDDAALDISRRLCADENIIATAHPAVVHFLTSPLMHSETLADHDLGLAVNDALATRAPAIAANGTPARRGAQGRHRAIRKVSAQKQKHGTRKYAGGNGVVGERRGSGLGQVARVSNTRRKGRTRCWYRRYESTRESRVREPVFHTKVDDGARVPRAHLKVVDRSPDLGNALDFFPGLNGSTRIMRPSLS